MDGDDTAVAVDVKSVEESQSLPVKSTATKKKGVKKGKRGKKKTRQMVILERLNKLANQYKADASKYKPFIERINKWFLDNLSKTLQLFKELDTENVGELTYEQFKAGMIDNNIPCNLIELHVIARLFDADGNLGIDFCEFEKGILYFSELEAETDAEREIKLLEPNEHIWINCSFSLITFLDHKEFPGHFTQLVNVHMYVAHLIQMIKSENRYTTQRLQIYTDDSRNIESQLAPDKTLDELGFRGGSYYQPKELQLFYDFDPFTIDSCLMSI